MSIARFAAIVVCCTVLSVAFMPQKAAVGIPKSEALHFVSKPKQTGLDVIKIRVKTPGGSYEMLPDIVVDVQESWSTTEKALRYAEAINNALQSRGHAEPALNAVAIGGESGYKIEEVTLQGKDGLTGSGQAAKKWQNVSDRSASASFAVSGSATGCSLDEGDPIVRVGTAQGVAEVVTGPGMTEEVIRDDLLAQLQALGIDADAEGPNGIRIDFSPADDETLEWGQSDSGIGTMGRLTFSDV